MKGFHNMGNTCYLNSALQMLMNMDEFCQMLRAIKTDSDKLNIVRHLIKVYHRQDDSSVLAPRAIKDMVGERKKRFGSYGQQDSSEFMIFLFDIIDEELKKDKIPGFNNILTIKSNINIKCKLSKCLKESEHDENNIFLHLPMARSLTECYQKYKMIEKLEGDNMYNCEGCNKKTISRKKIETLELPKNLLIIINRYDNRLRKDNSNIDMPLEWRHNYKLIGGIVHSGGYGGGHYYYFGKKDNRWYLFNDSNISSIHSNSQVLDLASKSYILHYKKSPLI